MRKSVIVIVSAALMSVGLSGCGLGQAVPFTISIGDVGNGVDAVGADRQVQDITIVTDGDSVGISATVINGSDSPVVVTAVDVRGAALELLDQNVALTAGIEVAANGAARLGYESTLSAVAASDLAAGEYAQVRFTFADGVILTAKALVVSKAGMYETVLTDPVATA
jgi:hypothetical protein